jgi:hypothetical protein
MLLSFSSFSRISQKFIWKNFYDLSLACFRKPRCEVLMAFALLSSALHPPKTGPRQRHGSTCCQTNKLVNSASLNDTLHNTAQHPPRHQDRRAQYGLARGCWFGATESNDLHLDENHSVRTTASRAVGTCEQKCAEDRQALLVARLLLVAKVNSTRHLQDASVSLARMCQ